MAALEVVQNIFVLLNGKLDKLVVFSGLWP
jgi:hypothetical protein